MPRVQHLPEEDRQLGNDALQDALLALIRAEQLPACGGVAATILLTMTSDQLATRSGLVATGHGATIALTQALELAGDAQLVPVVLDSLKAITAYGDTQRIFTRQQRHAMAARDHGCSFPDCDVPPAWCEAHHITDFALTRRTRVDDGSLLCGYHHREHERLGWHCEMINGLPHWIPPAWIDPARTPRRNHLHDPAPALI